VEPSVSVLLPAWNAEATLAAALESVRRQRDVALECVIVDDGSSDGTRALAAGFAARDARFRLLARAHGGLVTALAHGLDACRAPLVARMDADDVMAHDRLARQAAALAADPTLAGVGCHVRLFPRTDPSGGRRAYERWLNAVASPDDVAREAFVECPIAHPTLCIRREVLAAFGYRDRGWPEDYDLVLRLLGAGRRLGVVARRLVAWRDGPARLSRTHPAYALERFVACKAHHLAAGFLRAAPQYVLWGHGGTGRALRRALGVEGRRASHVIEVDPRKLGQRIDGAPVLAPGALPGLRGLPLVVSVAGPGPRAEIRAALAAMDFAEGRDFVCAA